MISREMLAKARRMEIRARRLVDSMFAGEYHSAFRGQGMEFSEVREYVPGDDVRTIDWKVTARLMRPHVRQYTEERELTVMLAIDGSASLDCASSELSRHEIAAQIASLVALAATRNKDRVGLMLFSDRAEHVIPPRKGRHHVLRIVRDILSFQPQNKGTSLNEALLTLEKVLPRRAVIFLISDFLDRGYEKTFRRVARRHQVVAIKLTDPLDAGLPDLGLVEVSRAEDGGSVLVDLGNRGMRERLISEQLEFQRSTEMLLKQSGAMLISVDTTKDPLNPLLKRFHK